MLKIEFDTHNGAFDGDYCAEVARTLKRIAKDAAELSQGVWHGVHDTNGNTIGRWVEDGSDVGKYGDDATA